MERNDEDVRQFCLALPKIELHAHLTGSVTRDTLHKIWLQAKADDAGLDLDDPKVALPQIWESTDFFHMFTKYIYRLVSNTEAVRSSTLDVLRAFAADGVAHLELRSTPRAGPAMTKDQYVCAVLDAMDEFSQTRPPMKTFLILSMDRRNTPEQAMEAVDLALRYQSRGVVGVDLCGDYKVGDARSLAPCFARAHDGGLHITIHFGETAHGYDELETLLSYMPTRLGHVIYITPEIRQEIVRRRLGVEICLTTNVVGKHVDSYAEHHLREWLAEGGGDYPLALCTDDVGVVESPGSNEYFLAATHLGLSYQQLWSLARSGIERCFVSGEDKEGLRRRLDEWRDREGRRWMGNETR